MIRFVFAVGTLALLAAPTFAEAQGLVGGAEEGAAAGDRAAGPIGGIVGGAVGGAVGTVNGALGIDPRYHRSFRSCVRHYGYRYCRRYY